MISDREGLEHRMALARDVFKSGQRNNQLENWIDGMVCVSILWKIRTMKNWRKKQLGGSQTTFEQ